MTAVKKYARLESNGFWKESKRSEFIEVLISFGKTSVILSDYNDNPLTHWSLTAIKLVSQAQEETIFSTDSDDGERLSIKDKHMIDALLLFIKKDAKKPENNKTTVVFYFLSFLFILVTLILYFPSKIKDLALSVISEQHEKQLIEPFLQNHINVSGGICNSSESDKIMSNILNFAEKDTRFLSLSIVRNQKMNVLHLPGGRILISSNFLKAASNEWKLIALLKEERVKASNRKPLRTLINQQTTFHLVQFILGFESQLSVTAINDFLIPSSLESNNQIAILDDFLWVTLQNTCLN